MARQSPLNPEHEAAGAVLARYGPDADGIPVVQVYTGIDREYAAIRKSAAAFDLPHRAVLSVTGADRLAFLNRMLTQELKDLPPLHARRSFWLNRKGRIDADLTVIALPDRILLELDAHAVKRTLDGLSAFVIVDDVQIEDHSDRTHRLSVHGPAAAAIVARVAAPDPGSRPITDLQPGQAGLYADGKILIWRFDTTGDPGFEWSVPIDLANDIYSKLSEPLEELAGDRDRPDRGFDLHDRPTAAADARAVRAGWHAFNLARIEAGTALYYLDFGPDSLPHETGEATLNDRVSFKKGCYLGQEIVARMQSLGHPKQQLVALDFPDLAPLTDDALPSQPVTGSRITESADPAAEAIGAVTSSGLGPMVGSRPICFAMLKHKHTAPGTRLHVHTETGETLAATVRESMVYWKRQG